MNNTDRLSDTDILNYLQDEQVDTIYLDDGRIIDVRSGNLREAVLNTREQQKITEAEIEP